MPDSITDPLLFAGEQSWHQRARHLRAALIGAMGEAAAMLLIEQCIRVRIISLEAFRYMGRPEGIPSSVSLRMHDRMEAVEVALAGCQTLGLIDRAMADEVRDWATSAPREMASPTMLRIPAAALDAIRRG